MAVVLQIIGGLVVFFFLLLIVGFLYLRWKLRQFGKELSNMDGMPNGFFGGPPTRMRLRPANRNGWEADEVAGSVAALDGLGYARISAYETPDMPGLKFLPYVSPDQKAYALVYHQPGGMGVWCDLFTKYEDGNSLTVTSAGRGGELEHRPGNEKAYLPGSSIEQLHEVHQARLQPKPVRQASIEGFVHDFESHYEEEMAWRATKGYSDAEVRAVAALDGESYSEEAFSQTKEALNLQANVHLTDILRRRYVAQSGISASEWEDQRDRIIVIHDKTPADEVLEQFTFWVNLDDAVYESLEEVDRPPRQLMDELIRDHARDAGFEKVATLREPVEADIWLVPENLSYSNST